MPELVTKEAAGAPAQLIIKTDHSQVTESALAFFQNLSPLTAQAYKQGVFEFLRFVGDHFPISSARDLKRAHIIAYRQTLDGQAQRTILKKLAAIASFCKFLAEDGLVDKDIVYGIKRPSARNKKETGDLSDKDVRDLFAKLDQTSVYYPHHKAILAVGFYTGLRSSEIRHLKIKDYGKVDGHSLLRAVIKGDKYHEIPLNPFVVRALDEHLNRLKSKGFTLTDEHYLFPSIKTRTNKPIHAESLRKIFLGRLSDAGINMSALRRYSPHSMRATLAGHLLNTVEAPLEEVQKALGHSSPTTTMRYNKRTKSHDKSPVYRIEY